MAERLRIYRGRERVAEADRQIEANIATMPALTPRQRDALRLLVRSQKPDASSVKPVTHRARPAPQRITK
jgi:hypothetical protein